MFPGGQQRLPGERGISVRLPEAGTEHRSAIQQPEVLAVALFAHCIGRAVACQHTVAHAQAANASLALGLQASRVQALARQANVMHGSQACPLTSDDGPGIMGLPSPHTSMPEEFAGGALIGVVGPQGVMPSICGRQTTRPAGGLATTCGSPTGPDRAPTRVLTALAPRPALRRDFRFVTLPTAGSEGFGHLTRPTRSRNAFLRHPAPGNDKALLRCWGATKRAVSMCGQ